MSLMIKMCLSSILLTILRMNVLGVRRERKQDVRTCCSMKKLTLRTMEST